MVSDSPSKPALATKVGAGGASAVVVVLSAVVVISAVVVPSVVVVAPSEIADVSVLL